MLIEAIVLLLCTITVLCVVEIISLMTDYYCNTKEFTNRFGQPNGNRFYFFFLLLKGRWSLQKAKTIKRFLVIGCIYILLVGIIIMANGWNLQSICYCLMTSAFLVISVVDWNTYEIPLPCNIFLGLLGIFMCIIDTGHIAEHLIGAVAVSAALYLLYVISKGAAIGGGDIKLIAATGLILGWKLVILGFFLGCIVASIIHVIRMKVSKADRVLAMGPYLCVGLWISALWGDVFIRWYFHML